MWRRTILVLACIGWMACGGDDDPTTDATPADASATVDSGSSDGGNAICETLCSCASQFCGQNETECLATCATLAPTVQACRTEHCGFAQTNPGLHCPHVAGVDEAGTPPACIAR